MALDTADVTIDFGQGLEQKTDSKRIPIGSLTVANNIMFTKDKQVRRRYGLTALGTGLDTGTKRIAASAKEPVILARNRLAQLNGGAFARTDIPQPSTSVTLPTLDDTAFDLRTITTGPSTDLQQTQAFGISTTLNVKICVFVEKDGIYYTLYDQDDQPIRNRSPLETPTALSGESFSNLRLVVEGSTAYCFYHRSLGTVDMAALNLSTYAITYSALESSAFSGSTLDARCTFDVMQINSTDYYLALIQNTATLGQRVKLTRRTFAGAVTWTVNHAGTVASASGAITIAQFDATTPTTTVVVYFVERGSANIRYGTCTSAGAAAATGIYGTHSFYQTGGGVHGVNAMTAVVDTTLSRSYLLLGGLGAQPITALAFAPDERIACYRGTIIAGSSPLILGHCLASKLYISSSAGDGPLYFATKQTGFGFLCKVRAEGTPENSSPQAICRFLLEETNSTQVNQDFTLAYPREFSGCSLILYNSQLHIPFARQTRSCSFVASSLVLYGEFVFGYAKIDYSTQSPPAYLDGRFFVGGSHLWDSNTTQGILDAPRIESSAVGVGGLVSGTRSFYVVATVNKAGITYRGLLSGVITLTGTTGYSFSVRPPLYLRDQTGSIRLELFATEANGSVFYLANSTEIQPGNGGALALFFQADVDTRQVQLYAQGGALENIPPAAPRWVCSAKSRLWCPSPENDTDLFHSSQPITGEDVRWHPDLVVKVPAEGGEITAVIEHNQRILVFKKNAVYAVSGDGPGLTGAGGTFQVDQLSTAYGCEGPSAIQLIPDGVIFKSADKGFWLVNNRYEFEYIGRGVDTYKARAITASAHVTASNQVRFLLDPTTTPSQVTQILVYDYYYKQWMLYTYQLASLGDEKVVDMCVSGDGRLYYLTNATTPRVIYEDSASYVDVAALGSSTYEAQLTTGWINFADVDGFQRVRYFDIQGTSAATANQPIDVLIYFDYDDATAGQSASFTLTTASAAAATKLMRRIYLADGKQKHRAMKIAINTVNNPSADRFAETTLTSMTFRLGIKKKAAPADEDRRS